MLEDGIPATLYVDPYSDWQAVGSPDLINVKLKHQYDCPNCIRQIALVPNK